MDGATADWANAVFTVTHASYGQA